MAGRDERRKRRGGGEVEEGRKINIFRKYQQIANAAAR